MFTFEGLFANSFNSPVMAEFFKAIATTSPPRTLASAHLLAEALAAPPAPSALNHPLSYHHYAHTHPLHPHCQTLLPYLSGVDSPAITPRRTGTPVATSQATMSVPVGAHLKRSSTPPALSPATSVDLAKVSYQKRTDVPNIDSTLATIAHAPKMTGPVHIPAASSAALEVVTVAARKVTLRKKSTESSITSLPSPSHRGAAGGVGDAGGASVTVSHVVPSGSRSPTLSKVKRTAATAAATAATVENHNHAIRAGTAMVNPIDGDEAPAQVAEERETEEDSVLYQTDALLELLHDEQEAAQTMHRMWKVCVCVCVCVCERDRERESAESRMTQQLAFKNGEGEGG
jgi:hypothetical protein